MRARALNQFPTVVGLVVGLVAGVPLDGVASPAPTAPAAPALELPAMAPGAKLVQQVGLTEITVEYDCAAVRGRKIWGSLVPYDRPWTIGANPAARIRFTKDVTIGDKLVPAGVYWLLATPSKSSWTFMINKSPDVIATPEDYKPRVGRRPRQSARPAGGGAPRAHHLLLLGDHRQPRLARSSMGQRARLVAHPSEHVAADRDGHRRPRRYVALVRERGPLHVGDQAKDYDAGLQYIDQSLALQTVEHKRDWYSLWIKGALLAGKGEFGEARELAQTAYDLAKQGGGSFDLEPDLKKAIADWGRRVRPLDGSGPRPSPLTSTSPRATPPERPRTRPRPTCRSVAAGCADVDPSASTPAPRKAPRALKSQVVRSLFPFCHVTSAAASQ